MTMRDRHPLLSTTLVLSILLSTTSATSATLVCPRPAAQPKLRIRLPLGAQPEGVTEGRGSEIFVSRVATGGVTAVDVFTGKKRTVVPDTPGRQALGLYARARRIFVAGGFGNALYVYNLQSGREVAACKVDGEGFINDVVVLKRKAYYTNSADGSIYELDLEDPGACRVKPIRLRQPDFEPEEGVFKANGIAKFRGGLLVAQLTSGAVYFVDPRKEFDVSEVIAPGEAETADGLAVDGRTLYVVQPALNRVGVWKLRKGEDGTVSARKTGVLLKDDFDVPTTAALVDEYLFVVNSRFGEILFGEAEPTDKFFVSGVNRLLL